MYPQIEGKQFELSTIAKLREYILNTKETIPFGNGRSYGDSALNTNMINCKNHNSFKNGYYGNIIKKCGNNGIWQLSNVADCKK